MAAMVNGVLKRSKETTAHTLDRPPERVEAEELVRRLELLEANCSSSVPKEMA
jgi:hypothetical protein